MFLCIISPQNPTKVDIQNLEKGDKGAKFLTNGLLGALHPSLLALALGFSDLFRIGVLSLRYNASTPQK